jgi:MFS family permease
MNLAQNIPSNKRFALVSVFFIVNIFIWYFLSTLIFQEILSNYTSNPSIVELMWVIHFATLAASLVGGAVLIKKIERRKLFLFWTILGVLSPFTLFALNFAPVPIALLFSMLFAVSTGLGMPNCMEYFTKSTSPGTRGRYAGAAFFLSGVGFFLLRLIGDGIAVFAIILIGWRLLGLLAVFAAKPFKVQIKESFNISYHSLIRQRSFVLYIIPWALFSFVNYINVPIQNTLVPPATFSFLLILENVISGVSALVAGHLIDHFGRKQASIAGFALLGISYAVLGIFPNITSWYIYAVFDGITWGILSVLFIITIWGELNPHVASDKYYALGVLPFFFSEFLSFALTNYVSIDIQNTSVLFSFTAFFLFLAVLPLVYAPETLPEKTMKDRELKSYIEKAQKIVEKETEKTIKKQNTNSEKQAKPTETPKEENSEEYEKAKKLAEKYY